MTVRMEIYVEIIVRMYFFQIWKLEPMLKIKQKKGVGNFEMKNPNKKN